jgi:pyridoxine 5-phosphate synthase
MNLEMAVTDSMLSFAEQVVPEHCCLVPEKREELTTEGGLDVISQEGRIKEACDRLSAIGSEVSLFIDPEPAQIEAAVRCGAQAIEIHTGHYAECKETIDQQAELGRIRKGLMLAQSHGLIVNAGHGLHYHNTHAIAALPGINELNIGHSIIARALFVGLKESVKEMRELIDIASRSALNS